MQGLYAICLAALPFIIYFLFNKALIRYFNNVFHKTNKNPITAFQQIIGLMFYSPIVIGLFDDELFLNPLICIGIPLVFTIVLLISNIKFVNPIRIVLLTFAQILFGFMFVCRFFVWIFMMTWSILMMILYGNGPAVTYNPFSRTKIDENGNVIQYKNRFFFVPDSYSDGVLVHMNKYTDDMNASRIESERRRLEQEIDEIESKKQYAMIYGFDTAGYDEKITKLNGEIENLR